LKVRQSIKWLAIAIIAVIVLAGASLLFLNTAPGKRFVLAQIRELKTQSGLSIRAESLDGSLFGRMELSGVEVHDAKGAVLSAPRVTIDWRPFAYLSNTIDIRQADAAIMRLARAPMLSALPNAPILPEMNIAIGSFSVGQLIVEPPVSGHRHSVGIAGRADIANGRAVIIANASALAAPGMAGGDKIALMLDAVPGANRLAMRARVSAPAGGMIDSYMQTGKAAMLAIDGHGTWAAWNGRAAAQIGGTTIANLPISGRNGIFTVRGRINPALLMTGPMQRLSEPGMAVEIVTTLARRRADGRIALHSPAIAINAKGVIDFAENRFDDVAIEGQLTRPGAIASNLSGGDVRWAAVVNGPFRAADFTYRVGARNLGIGRVGFVGLAARGTGRFDGARIRIPLIATAQQVTGLNAAASVLLNNVAVNGDLAWTDGRLQSDNLRLKSDKIDATGIAIADMNRGVYTGALKGRIDDYQVDSIGRLTIITDAKLRRDPRSGFGMTGVASTVTNQITNSVISAQTEGKATTIARFDVDSEGNVRFANVRMTSPGLAIFDGDGRYAPDGRFEFRGRGQSKTYGPLSAVASGTFDQPRVRLLIERPGFGIGLKQVIAQIDGRQNLGAGAGYAVRASGGSSYGPFNADILIRGGAGPLTLDVQRGRIAGIDVRGQLQRLTSGPFAGRLNFSGSGITGNAVLDAAEPFNGNAAARYQRANFVMQASGGRIPGDRTITIGGGSASGQIILFPEAPAIRARFALSNVVRSDVLISRAQGRIDYQNGRGTAAVIANGKTSTPFSVAAQAAFAPDRILANARGTANGIAFQLSQPATMTRAGGIWTLQPAQMVLPQGRVMLTGRYDQSKRSGSGIEGRAALNTVDLGIVQTFAPGLGLGGKATGTIDYDASGKTTARIAIADFTRTAANSVSPAVNVAMLANLSTNGGDVRAVIRRGAGDVIGRLQMRLNNGDWARAGLAGGIRYNGPADVLWTLTGIADQSVAGPIVVAADFGGTVDQPTLAGLVRGDALRYENQTYGSVITDLAVGGRFTQSQLQLTKFEGRAGRGSVTGQGTIGLDAARGYPADLRLTFANAQLTTSDVLGAAVSGTLTIANGASGGRVSGELTVPRARYEFIRQGSAELTELTGVRRRDAEVDPRGPRPTPSTIARNIALDIRIRSGQQIFVSGLGLDAEWGTDMQISGTAANPRIVGALDVVRGTYSFAGRRFALDDNGRITFDGSAFNNPQLSMVARATVEGVSATINITGRAQNPQISFSSTPALPQDEVLSRLLFGSSITQLSPTQAIQLAAALNSLRSNGGGLNPLGKLKSAVGISRLRILSADASARRGTALAVGQYLTNNIYVEVVTDARGFTATQLEIGLSRALSLLSTTSSFGSTSATIRYSRDY
jgi:translocation and assembly module TamB